MLNNPSGSPIVEATLLDLVRDPDQGVVTLQRLYQLLHDSARISGNTRRQVVYDILKNSGGRRMTRKLVANFLLGNLKRKKFGNNALRDFYFQLWHEDRQSVF